MHPDTHRRGGGADDRADLLIPEVRAVTQRQQVLVLRPQQPDQRAELLSSLAFEDVLLGGEVRGRSLLGERLRGPVPLDVAHRVPCDLEQPAGETALPAKPPELLERRREHPTSHVLAGGRVRHPQPRVPKHPIEIAVIQPEKLARIPRALATSSASGSTARTRAAGASATAFNSMTISSSHRPLGWSDPGTGKGPIRYTRVQASAMRASGRIVPRPT